jgi:glycosyltransferase involved in cell wall biosynthesis
MPEGPQVLSGNALPDVGADAGVLRGFRLLYLVDNGFPTFQSDVAALFGRYMAREGLSTDIVARRNDGVAAWSAGRLYLSPRKSGRIVPQVLRAFHDTTCLARIRKGTYAAIQVRNKVFTAVLALWTARRLGIPFFYVMSYPKSDGVIWLAREHGRSLGTARWLYWLVKGHAGRWILHAVVLRYANHVFVQSDRMRADLAARNVPLARMTAIPMGFDPERYQPPPAPVADERLRGRRIIAYLGTCERIRRVDVLFDVVARLMPSHPGILLLIIGDAIETTDKAWLRRRIAEAGASDSVIITGWLAQADADRYLATADVGLAVFQPDPLLASASPTKLVEYLAMGKPVVANDHPDQRQVIEASGAGFCTDFDVARIADAIDTLLANPDLRATMGARGKRYILAERSYEIIAGRLGTVYASLLSSDARIPKGPT